MIAAPAGGVPIALVHSGLPITQIDQQNPGPFQATNGAQGFFIFGQSFAPSLPGIDSFEFLLGGEDATVYLRILDGVRNIGQLDGTAPVSGNRWEEIKSAGTEAVKRWIDRELQRKSCLIVLIGARTATRPLVRYEIEKAWSMGLGVVGAYIHNLRNPNRSPLLGLLSTNQRGPNPFDSVSVVLDQRNSLFGTTRSSILGGLMVKNTVPLSTVVKAHDPVGLDSRAVYGSIASNLPAWVEQAIQIRGQYR
ncbi:MAG: hypothetical protein E6K81_15385 [Candidatus Eisenbacteria bacterium]|uniref:Thoeris protein ThsB TIR-like domain-containing protein n=1 Tax=Eiseniibacteriota bacterium TaxID=2212470 RepID=A0A538U052_UNCEI|nr:MAG: hypothetical protein E6K81_15385 [Candidatus Eisenbacteria bacterium]